VTPISILVCYIHPEIDKHEKMKRRLQLIAGLMLVSLMSLMAQTTLNSTVGSTGYTGSNGCGTGTGGACYITFVVENSSGAPILLTNVGQWTSTANNGNTIDLYYSATSLGGAPGGSFNTTTPPTGWSVAASGTISGITATQVNTVLSNMTFTIPAGTTYRFAVVPSGTVSYSGTGVGTASPNTFSSGGVHLRTGDYQINSANVGYGGPNNPRFFTGSITFAPAGPCTDPPVPGTTTTNKSITCSGETFNLGLTGFSSGTGQTFQWQISTDNITWTNITGATSPNYTTSQTTSNYYRCSLTCGTTTNYSVSVQVTTTAVALPGGTYTINGGLATGGSNFNSFTDFRQAIVCGGISGPVVVNVINKGSDYAEQLNLGSIGGTSAINTITINGNNQTITSAGGAQYGTVLLNGASFITIKKLKIAGTATANNFGLHITGGASNIVIDSCEISINPASTSILTVPLAISGSLTSATLAGISGTNITVKNSVISGGYYCVTMTGPAGVTTSTNNVLENNIVKDYYLYGGFFINQPGTQFKGNDFNRANRTGLITTFYGMYFNGAMNGTQVVGNRVHSPANQNPTASFTSYPIFMSAANALVGQPMNVANNAVYNINGIGLTYGIYLASGAFIDLYHNTVSLDNTQATTSTGVQRALFVGATTSTFNIKNNLFSITHGGTGAKHLTYFSSTAPTFNINNNQYYLGSSAGTSNFFSYWSAANVATFTAWKAVNSSAFDQQGVEGDPVFNTTGFVPQSAPGNGAGANLLLEVPTDIFGVARTATPDIGAAEYTPLPCLQPYGISGTATLSSVTLTWTNVAGADSVRIEYGGAGFVQGTGTVLFVTGDSTVISGLSSQTCYDFYMTTYCGGAVGNGVALYTICTPCGNQTMPYVQPFTTWAPQCFDLFGTSTWNWQHNITGYAMAPFWSFSTGQATMRTATVAVTQAAQVKFKWAHAYNTSYPDDRLVVRAQKIGTTVWDTLADFIGPTFNSPNSGTTTPPANASDFVTHTSYLNPSYVGGAVVVEFIGLTDFGPNVFIDDFEVSQVPPCTPPIGVAAANITASSAQISWSTISGNCFKVEYGPQGFVQGTGVGGVIINNATSPTTLSNLSPNTFYDVYVQDCCNPGVWVGPITFKTACLAQLSGIYTVGGTAGPTNFATLDSAIAVLTGCGVSGPVTFNLQGAATKNIGSKTFGAIAGASATNTITFNGRGVSADTVNFAGGSSVGFTFNGTKYVKFQNMTINGAATSITVRMHNNAQFLTFENCHIWNSPTTITFSTAVIAASNSATSATTAGDNASNITIKNCKLVGGYYGISIYGPSSTTFVNNFTFEDNEFVDQYYYGISMYYAANITVLRNNVSGLRNTFSYGYYGFYNTNVSIKQSEFFATAYGIYLSQLNTVNVPTTNSEITNNFVGGNTYGLYFSTYGKVNIHHNSMLGGNSGYYAFTPNADVNIRNNIFVGGTSYAFYNSAATSTNYVVDYNLYHTSSATAFAFNGVVFASLAAWKTAQPLLNINSISGDPGFLSNTDLHIVGTLPNNVGLNGLAVIDIDGDVRPGPGGTVDMGADEFTPLNWDASLENLIVDLGGCGNAASPIAVEVKNFGLNTITSLPITVAITGGITATVNTTATVNIPQGGTAIVPVGTFNSYNGAAGVNFSATLALVGDQKATNDTKSRGPGNYIPFEPPTSGVVDTVCPNGAMVDLWALSIPGTTYAWFNTLTGGTKIASGDTISVPANGPTTYYVQYDSATANPQVGTGTLVSTSTNITPYKTFFMDGRSQYLILASEMAALGVVGGGEINSLAFDVVTVGSPAMTDFAIKLGGTTVSAMTATFQPTTGMTTVFNSPSFSPVAGWNVHTFTTPFMWNGTDNILIEVCYNNSAWTTNSSVRYTTTPFPSITDGFTDNATASGCTPGVVTPTVASNRPNMQMNLKTIACSNIRKPVSFALNPASAVADYSFTVQANGADVNFNASASIGQIFDWTFGDGGTASGVTVSHTYTVGNTYNACLIVTDTVCNSSDTICKSVLVTVGLDEGLIGQSLNLYPNPNSGKFRVEFQVEGLKNVELRVMSLLGQTLHSSKPGNISGTYREEIDLSSQAAGVYILQIISEDGTVSRRVTVRK